MFLRHWNRVTGRKDRRLPYFMLAVVAGWVVLELGLPGAHALGPMIGIGMGGMMMRPTTPMTIQPMNANGTRYSGPGMAYPGGGMSGSYSGGNPYGSRGGDVNGGSTESPLPRSLDGFIDDSSTNSTSGSRNGYAKGDGHRRSQDGYTKRSASESPLPRRLDGYIDGSSTSSSNGLSRSGNGYTDGDRQYGSQQRASTASPLPRSLDGYIDGSSTSNSYRPSRSRSDHADGKLYREKLTTWVPLIVP
jgi:hypothetical protein